MRLFGLILALALAGSVAAVAQARDGGGSSSPHHGALHVTKDCTGYAGQTDGHCTIQTSNLKAIPPGSRVVYLEPAGASGLDSDVVLVAGPGNVANGHVTLDFATGTGTVTFSGGTGVFDSFHAKVAVSSLGGTLWAWDGTYSFNSHGDR
jgi:hypothetical protein